MLKESSPLPITLILMVSLTFYRNMQQCHAQQPNAKLTRTRKRQGKERTAAVTAPFWRTCLKVIINSSRHLQGISVSGRALNHFAAPLRITARLFRSLARFPASLRFLRSSCSMCLLWNSLGVKEDGRINGCLLLDPIRQSNGTEQHQEEDDSSGS
jgi:hypothetical protein